MARRQGSATDASSSTEPQTAAKLPRTRLATRIALAATGLTFGFVLLIGGLSYTFTRRQLIDNEVGALRTQASLYAQQLGNTLRAVTTTLSKLAENTLILNALMDSLTPVSYTHLDVYKRQPVNSDLAWPAWIVTAKQTFPRAGRPAAHLTLLAKRPP